MKKAITFVLVLTLIIAISIVANAGNLGTIQMVGLNELSVRQAVEAYSVQICSYDVLNGAWGPGVFNATTMFTSAEDFRAKIAEWEALEAYDFSATTDECPKSFYDISDEYDEAYFQTHILLLVVSSSSHLPDVKRIDHNGHAESMRIYLESDWKSDGRDLYRVFIEIPADLKEIAQNAQVVTNGDQEYDLLFSDSTGAPKTADSYAFLLAVATMLLSLVAIITVKMKNRAINTFPI